MVGRAGVGKRKMGTRYFYDDYFSKFLHLRYAKGLEVLKQEYAPLTLDSILTDASKYRRGVTPVGFDQDLCDYVVERMSEHYLNVFQTHVSVAPQVEKAFDAFPLSTSSTYDGRTAGPCKGHLLAQYIQFGKDSILAEVADWVTAGCQVYYKNGFLYTNSGIRIHDSLAGKDEIRPLEKHGKTRAFIVPSIYSYCAQWYLFSDFAAKYQSASLRRAYDVPIGWAGMLGVPIQQRGYHEVIKSFLQKKYQGCFDVSQWDGSLFPEIFEAVGKIWWKTLVPYQRTKSLKRARDNIIKMIYATPVIFPDGFVRTREGGMPSGVFVTLLFNSIADEMLFAYCVMRILGRMTMEELHQLFVVMVMGDDINAAADFDIFDQLVEEYALLGITITTESERSFCSHSFVETDGVWHLSASADRLLASMFLKSSRNLDKGSSLSLTLGRACSLLAESFGAGRPTGFDISIEELLRQYIEWLCKLDYMGKPYSHSTECMKVLRGYFTPSQLRKLFLGDKQGVVKAVDFALAPPYYFQEIGCSETLPQMSNKITQSLSPGSTAQEHSRPSERRKSGGDSAQDLVSRSGAGASRLSVLSQHIFDHKAQELDYLKTLLYPSEVNKSGIPDLGTTVPTAKYYFKNAGTVTTSAGNAFLLYIFPTMRSAMRVVTGSSDYGYLYAADPATKRSIVQLEDLINNGAATGYRRTGRRITLKFLESITETQGQIAWANCTADPTSGIAPLNLADVVAVPGSMVGTAAELFKDGSASFPLLTEACIQGTSGLPYNELAFIEMAKDSSQSFMNYIVIAGSGLPATTPLLQVVDDYCCEVTTNSQLIPTTINGGTMQGVHAAMQLVQHPRVIAEASHPASKPTALARAVEKPSGLFNWIGSRIKEGEDFGGEVADLMGDVMSAGKTIINGVEKVAPYAASIAPLFML